MERVGPQVSEMPLEGESAHGVYILLLLCVAFIKIPRQPSCRFFSGMNWRNPRVFHDMSEDVKTLLGYLRNLEIPVGKATFCLRESYQGSFWCDG